VNNASVVKIFTFDR